MLEQLFGSKTRTQLLRTFLQNPGVDFFVRELTRKIDVHINAVRHELENLRDLGLVEAVKPATRSAQKRHYRLNQSSVLYPELRALFLKSRVLLEKDLVKRLRSVGRIKYFAITGRFLGRAESPTDLFIVGSVERRKFSALIRQFEVAFGHEINFTIMEPDEMRYRMDVMDRFVYSVLDEPKMVFIDEVFGGAEVAKEPV